jgi:hypothetical protein
MSGVFTVAVGLNLALHWFVKIPDIRIELRSKRIPGTREEGVVPKTEVPWGCPDCIATIITQAPYRLR